MPALLRPASTLYVFLVLTLAGAGCDNIRAAIHCENICKKYEDCIDRELSVDKCTDRCTDEADHSKTLAKAAGRCSDCIDDRSCSEVSERCDSCNEVVQSFDEGGSF